MSLSFHMDCYRNKWRKQLASKYVCFVWCPCWQLLHEKSFRSYYFIYDFMTTRIHQYWQQEKSGLALFYFVTWKKQWNCFGITSTLAKAWNAKQQMRTEESKLHLNLLAIISSLSSFLFLFLFYLIVRKWSATKTVAIKWNAFMFDSLYACWFQCVFA